MKHKSDINIGKRAFAEAISLFPNETTRSICRKLGCGHHTLGYWRDGAAPSAMFLARLHELGADVIWILTGKRRYPEPTPDFLAEYEEEYNG